MKLAQIRKADKAELIQAVKDLCHNQYRLTLGEMHATSRTILDRWLKLGLDKVELNKLARGES